MSFEPYFVNGIPVTLYYREPGGPIWYNFRVRGERWRNSTKVYSERDARIVVREIVLSALAQAQSPAPLSQLTVRDAAAVYLKGRFGDEPAAGNRTYQDAKSRLGIMCELYGAERLPDSIADARALLHRFLDARQDKAARTRINDQRIVSRFYGWLMARKHVPWEYNPAAAAELPTPDEPDPEPLSDDEVEILLACAPLMRLWPVVVLCLGVGTRPHEAIRMEWADVNFKTGMVRAVNGKGSKARHCAMNSWVVRELKKWRTEHEDEAKVWPFNKFTANDQMAAIRERAWLPEHVTLQALRQTACTRAILAGMELADYVRHFGHSLQTAQRHYLKLGKVERREKLECLAFG